MTRRQLLLVLGIFAAYCGLTQVVPPFDDEFYYWCWTEHLQLSYYDHPPMTAYLIKAATVVFGDTLFAVRLPACLSTAVVFAVVLALSRPKSVAWWLLVTPLFNFGAVIVTPDTPLLMFWAAYLYWLVHVHRQLTPPEGEGHVPFCNWLIGGALLGCGVLGKYTTGLAVPAGFVTFLLVGQWRKWFFGYVFHGVIAFLVASPILIHNIRHDFIPLLYQWKHSMSTIDPGLKRFGEFVGIQILLFGTMPFALLPWVFLNWRRLATDPRLRVCLCLYGFPFLFFLYKATRGPLEGNWALVSYIAFWPLAAEWYASVQHKQFWRRAMPAGFLVPAIATVLAAVHLVHPLSFIKPLDDRLTRQVEKHELAKRIKAEVDQLPEHLPVYADSYQWVALLRFCGVDAHQIDGITRPSHFTQRPEQFTDVPHGYIFWNGDPWTFDPEAPKRKLLPAKGLTERKPLKVFPLNVRGELITGFILWEYRR
ncbi:glycosyltransferase family 39 protein [Limnoglobus roseus]|uniref:GT83 family glycosyltransferase n=1 Tax=Limnoglobus roseus TaxID=2598579 RepID=A0A5C1AI02_9BACT|nr:glycosyltransferase family 39 protein [Limnoglobus roseus]QEL18470.1 GT83 family glycosyltransferase [Limnoglobus roseus]